MIASSNSLYICNVWYLLKGLWVFLLWMRCQVRRARRRRRTRGSTTSPVSWSQVRPPLQEGVSSRSRSRGGKDSTLRLDPVSMQKT